MKHFAKRGLDVEKRKPIGSKQLKNKRREGKKKDIMGKLNNNRPIQGISTKTPKIWNPELRIQSMQVEKGRAQQPVRVGPSFVRARYQGKTGGGVPV